MNYQEAYSFADTVTSVVRSPDACGYSDDVLPDFFGFRESEFFHQIEKPRQKTLLHVFIYEINAFGYRHGLQKAGPEHYLPACEALLDSANLPRPLWLNQDQAEDHMDELEVLVDRACMVVTDAAFHLLFSDRTFLFEFNQMIARYVRKLTVGEHSCIVAPGQIRRESYFPVWLKNAVFHRDKGHCQLCGKDLTNLFVPTEQRHIDHMVPLKRHGTNDPTNFQLACGVCNTSKGATVLAKDHLTYPYW